MRLLNYLTRVVSPPDPVQLYYYSIILFYLIFIMHIHLNPVGNPETNLMKLILRSKKRCIQNLTNVVKKNNEQLNSQDAKNCVKCELFLENWRFPKRCITLLSQSFQSKRSLHKIWCLNVSNCTPPHYSNYFENILRISGSIPALCMASNSS